MKRLLVALALLILLPWSVIATSGFVPNEWYVSRSGTGAGGTSWATAWTELNRIDWSLVQAGDTIFVDGGTVACPATGDEPANCGMVYNTALSFGQNNVTVKLGTGGTVILDANQTNFTYCQENAPMPLPRSSPSGAVLGTAVTFNGRNGAVLDGTKWGGFVIRNGLTYGINLGGGDDLTVRYVKIHHINNPADTTNNSVGITQGYTAERTLVEKVEIYRNGQDALRVAGDVYTLTDSYIHDHYCNHPDGIQAFVPTGNAGMPLGVGEISLLSVTNNVFEDIGLQQVFLGENATHDSWVNGALIKNNLFINSFYGIKTKNGKSSNLDIDHNTFVVSDEFVVEWCCASPGSQAPMTLRSNIFYQTRNPSGTGFFLSTNGLTLFTNNCLFQAGGITGQYTQSGTIIGDPKFVSSTDFNLQAGSVCTGLGSTIGNADELVGAAGTPSPTPTRTPTATATRTTTPTATRTATASPSPSVTPSQAPTATPTLACIPLSEGLLCLIPNTATPQP